MVKLAGNGKKLNPYIINDINNLIYLSKNPILWDQHLYFSLLCDIDAKNYNFTPIGWQSVKFNGVFIGNGRRIKNLTINLCDIQGVGLFGYLDEGAQIKSVILANVNICGEDVCGAIAGCNEGGKIKYCKIESGTIKAAGTSIGICVGANYNGGSVYKCGGKALLINSIKEYESDKKENIVGCNYNSTYESNL